MTDQTVVVDTAIQKLLESYQELADGERAQVPLREAAMERVDQLVDDMIATAPFDEAKITGEMLGAYGIFEKGIMTRMQQGDLSAQMAMAKFDPAFMQGLKNMIRSLPENPDRMRELQTAIRDLSRDLRPPRVQTNFPMFEIVMIEPKENFGRWTAAIVPVIVDDNYKAKLLEKLDFDFYLSAEITPHQSLTSEFNVPGRIYKAGQKIEPFVLTHDTVENGPQTVLHVRGHVYKNDGYAQTINFPALKLEKQDAIPQGLDMAAILRALSGGGMPGGPGPNGPL